MIVLLVKRDDCSFARTQDSPGVLVFEAPISRNGRSSLLRGEDSFTFAPEISFSRVLASPENEKNATELIHLIYLSIYILAIGFLGPEAERPMAAQHLELFSTKGISIPEVMAGTAEWFRKITNKLCNEI